MLAIPVISFLIFLPIVSVFVILTIKGDKDLIIKNIRYISILTSCIHLALSLYIWFTFGKLSFGYQFVEEIYLFNFFSYNVGLDGISLLFLVFSSILFLVVFLVFPFPKNNTKLYAISFLLILSASSGTFSALDIVLFYIFYEASIIPVFFLLGIFGTGNYIYANFKFLLYTIFGSILMIIAIVFTIFTIESSFIPSLNLYAFNYNHQYYLFLAIFIAFLIKSGLFPVHTWMPDIYHSSPFALNIILSGVLLKYGIYGMIKILIPTFSLAVIDFYYYIYIVCLISMIYSGLIAFKQDNAKKIFAYLSISHMSLIVAGIFSANIYSIEGAIYQGLSHSIYNTGLFICLYYLNKRFSDNNISKFSGIATNMPIFSLLFIIIGLSAMSFPLTNSFIGELFLLLGIFQNYRVFGILFSFSVLISAMIIIKIYRTILFGELNENTKNFKDVNFSEFLILGSIVLFIFLMGIYPDMLLDFIHASVSNVVEQFRNGINYNILN